MNAPFFAHVSPHFGVHGSIPDEQLGFLSDCTPEVYNLGESKVGGGDCLLGCTTDV